MKKFYSTMPFSTQGGVYGKRWARLDRAYASRKAKKYPGRNILIASGKMSRSFRFRSSSKQVTLTNKDEKFRWHQLGAGNLPQRVMMIMDKQRKKTVTNIMAKELSRKVRKA